MQIISSRAFVPGTMQVCCVIDSSDERKILNLVNSHTTTAERPHASFETRSDEMGGGSGDGVGDRESSEHRACPDTRDPVASVGGRVVRGRRCLET